MGRTLVLAVIAVATFSMLAGASASSKGGGFKGFATCAGPPGTPDPIASDYCVVGSGFGAVFIAKNRDRVRYKLCVQKPEHDKDCIWERTRNAGNPAFVPLYAGEVVGTYHLKWRVPGRGTVDKDSFYLDVGD